MTPCSFTYKLSGKFIGFLQPSNDLDFSIKRKSVPKALAGRDEYKAPGLPGTGTCWLPWRRWRQGEQFPYISTYHEKEIFSQNPRVIFLRLDIKSKVIFFKVSI